MRASTAKGSDDGSGCAAMATRLTVFQVHELWIEVNSRAMNRLLTGWRLCARAAGEGIGLELNLKTWTTVKLALPEVLG